MNIDNTECEQSSWYSNCQLSIVNCQFSLNPLLLRELRQLVRNRFIIVMINLFIAILVFACMMNVLFRENTQTAGVGDSLFTALAVIMTLACFTVVVVYTAMTTASERINGDLMFISSLKPSSIVFGKAISGAVLTVLLMSITAPFVTLAYLLRGLDIEMVAVTFLCVFTTIQVLNGAAIAIFSSVKTKVQMTVLLGVGFFVVLFTGGWLIEMIAREFLAGGGLSSNWNEFCWFLLIETAFLSLLLASAVAAIAPPTSNRMLPVRVTVTILYLASLCSCIFFPTFFGTASPLTDWACGWIQALVVLTILVVCERESWSVRIKRTIPKNFLLRTFVFPFYSGSPNGIVWIGLLIGMIYVAVASLMLNTISSDIEKTLLLLLFAFDFGVTALLIRSWLLPKSVTSEKTWIVMFLLIVFCSFGGMLLFFLLASDSTMYGNFYEEYAASYYSAPNPFLNPMLIGSDGNTNLQLRQNTAIVWAVVLVVPLLIWFVMRVLSFSPYALHGTMTLQQAVDAVREADENPLVQSDAEIRRRSTV